MMTRKPLAVLTLLVAITLTACSVGPELVDATTIEVSPAHGAAVTNLDEVTATFAHEVHPNTVANERFTVHDGEAFVEGEVSYDAATRTLVFTPAVQPLAGGRTYTATISRTLRFVSDHKLASDLVWTFTTEAATPVVIGVTNTSFTYDGKTKGIDVVTDPADVAYTVAYSLGGEPVASPVGAGEYDYTVTVTQEGFAGRAAGRLMVAKAPLVGQVKGAEKAFDGKPYDGEFEIEYSGFVNGEDESALIGEPVFGGRAIEAVNPGSHEITASGVTAANYEVELRPGVLRIGFSEETLHVWAVPVEKAYDGEPFTDFEVELTGPGNGQLPPGIMGQLTFEGTAVGAVDAGTYTITPTGILSLYYPIHFHSADLTINQADLVISAVAAEKTYDGQPFTAADADVDVDGLAERDQLEEIVGQLEFLGNAIGAVAAGPYTLDVAGNGAHPNYEIHYVAGALVVKPAPLIIEADDKSKVYDGQVYREFTATFTGFVGEDGPADLPGALTFGPDEYTVDAGQYDLVPGGLPPGNYAYDYRPGTFVIEKAPLTIKADDKEKTYDGGVFEEFTASYHGLVAGDHESHLLGELQFGGSAVGAVNANEYTITASGLSSSNYDITFEQGTLTVHKRPLTVTAVGTPKPYDGQPHSPDSFSVSYSGFAEGEDEQVLQGTVVFGGPAADPASVLPDNYALTVSGLSSDNYAITFEPGSAWLMQRKATARTPANGEQDVGLNADMWITATFGYDFRDPSVYRVSVAALARETPTGWESVRVTSLEVTEDGVRFKSEASRNESTLYRATVYVMRSGALVATEGWMFTTRGR